MNALRRVVRQAFIWVAGMFLRVDRLPLSLPKSPKILVVRTDTRVGNVLMTTPFLDSLKQRFPSATVHLVASTGEQLLGQHPSLDRLIMFRKKSWFSDSGPFRIFSLLAANKYDVAIDCTNPTDPSVTQALLTRLAGAMHTVGFDHPGFGYLYSAALPPPPDNEHEIDLRLQLLKLLPGKGRNRRMSLGPLPAPSGGAASTLAKVQNRRFGIVNVGARLKNKTLSPQTYEILCDVLLQAGVLPVVTYGPKEQPLAEQVVGGRPDRILASHTSLVDLANLMQAAALVLTADTGPMHLAVALRRPTCGIFVSTEPKRYGYPDAPHCIIDAREEFGAHQLKQLKEWCGGFAQSDA